MVVNPHDNETDLEGEGITIDFAVVDNATPVLDVLGAQLDELDVEVIDIEERVDGNRITFHEGELHVASIWQPPRDKGGKAPDFAHWYTANNAGTTTGKNCIALAREAIAAELSR